MFRKNNDIRIVGLGSSLCIGKLNGGFRIIHTHHQNRPSIALNMDIEQKELICEYLKKICVGRTYLWKWNKRGTLDFPNSFYIDQNKEKSKVNIVIEYDMTADGLYLCINIEDKDHSVVEKWSGWVSLECLRSRISDIINIIY